MKATAAIAIILCMIPAVCIIVWIGIHFAKRHIKNKSAMSKAYYGRAREGVSNNTDVELGPLNAKKYTVKLAPYRYGNRNKQSTFIRPTRDQRARRIKMNIQGTKYHVVENRPSSREAVSVKLNHRSDHESNRAQQDAKLSKKEKKKRKQLQKQKERQQEKEKEKGKWKHKEKEKEEKHDEDNQWHSRSQNDKQSHHDSWKPQSNRGSKADGRSLPQSQHSQHDAGFEELGMWANYETEEQNKEGGNQNVDDWNEGVQEGLPASHHGSGNAGWSNHDNQSAHDQKW
jgi:hypothetical protein